jgi:DNA repair protein RadC
MNMKREGRYTVKTVRVRLRVSEPLELVRRPADAARIAEAVYRNLDADQEHFTILALDAQHQMIGFKVISSGGMDSAHVDFRLVFRAALLLGAASIIVVHNHPSGDSDPSSDDMQITVRLIEAGALLGLPVLDHIVLGAGCYHSFGEHGLMSK